MVGKEAAADVVLSEEDAAATAWRIRERRLMEKIGLAMQRFNIDGGMEFDRVLRVLQLAQTDVQRAVEGSHGGIDVIRILEGYRSEVASLSDGRVSPTNNLIHQIQHWGESTDGKPKTHDEYAVVDPLSLPIGTIDELRRAFAEIGLQCNQKTQWVEARAWLILEKLPGQRASAMEVYNREVVVGIEKIQSAVRRLLPPPPPRAVVHPPATITASLAAPPRNAPPPPAEKVLSSRDRLEQRMLKACRRVHPGFTLTLTDAITILDGIEADPIKAIQDHASTVVGIVEGFRALVAHHTNGRVNPLHTSSKKLRDRGVIWEEQVDDKPGTHETVPIAPSTTSNPAQLDNIKRRTDAAHPEVTAPHIAPEHGSRLWLEGELQQAGNIYFGNKPLTLDRANQILGYARQRGQPATRMRYGNACADLVLALEECINRHASSSHIPVTSIVQASVSHDSPASTDSVDATDPPIASALQPPIAPETSPAPEDVPSGDCEHWTPAQVLVFLSIVDAAHTAKKHGGIGETCELFNVKRRKFDYWNAHREILIQKAAEAKTVDVGDLPPYVAGGWSSAQVGQFLDLVARETADGTIAVRIICERYYVPPQYYYVWKSLRKKRLEKAATESSSPPDSVDADVHVPSDSDAPLRDDADAQSSQDSEMPEPYAHGIVVDEGDEHDPLYDLSIILGDLKELFTELGDPMILKITDVLRARVEELQQRKKEAAEAQQQEKHVEAAEKKEAPRADVAVTSQANVAAVQTAFDPPLAPSLPTWQTGNAANPVTISQHQNASFRPSPRHFTRDPRPPDYILGIGTIAGIMKKLLARGERDHGGNDKDYFAWAEQECGVTGEDRARIVEQLIPRFLPIADEEVQRCLSDYAHLRRGSARQCAVDCLALALWQYIPGHCSVERYLHEQLARKLEDYANHGSARERRNRWNAR